MNKILTLLIVAVLIFQSIKPFFKVFFKQRVRRKEHKLNFGKQFNHLFAATLLLLIPLLCIISYFHLLPPNGQLALVIFTFVCGIGACICFYLYKNYLAKTPYESLIYDPRQATIELLGKNGRQLIPLSYVRGIEWHGIKNSLKLMPWSSFEYLVLEFKNGNTLVIPSVIMAPAQLSHFLLNFEVIHIKSFFPTIK
jgi:hypothetical protein